VLTEKLDDIAGRLGHTPRKSLKHLAQKTGVSKPSARTATQLLKPRPYKTTVIHALQPRDPASRVHFCSWSLQGYINTQNNHYWSSENPRLTHEVPHFQHLL
jgi:hypothetical protein